MVDRPIFERLRAALSLRRREWCGSGRQAGVLVALSDEPEPTVLLGRRASHLRLHPGEIAFPGGKREPEDLSSWDTALRESLEEVGLEPGLVEPLGELPHLVTRSDYEVHPCVARVPVELDLRVDREEFDELIRPPLALFADPARYRLERMDDGERQRRVPHYTLGDDSIWGVTAAVLVQLVNLVYDAGLDLRRDWQTRP